MSGYTKVDNWLFDFVMPNAKPNTFKVVSAIARQTWGWKKNSDVISLTRLETLTGIKNRGTLHNAIMDALDNHFIGRARSGMSFRYFLMTSPKIVLVDDLNQSENRTDTSPKTVPELVRKSDTQKEILNKKEKKKRLQAHFTSIAGLLPGLANFDTHWDEPLGMWIDNTETLEEAEALVSRAYEFARSGDNGTTYKVTSPKSLVVIAANLKPENTQGVGTR